jgi:DNA helicase HerA-like ATPase
MEQAETLRLGNIVDTGIEQKNNAYNIDINALVRHSLVVGSTGCGKTTTCKTIINAVLERDIPILIIEPAKDEYVRWAVRQKQAGHKVNIFMPGVKNLEGEHIQQLKLNPFQPASVDGAPIDMMTRCEQLTALINASLPASDVLPVIIDEAFFSFLAQQPFGEMFMQGEMEQMADYPKLDGVLPVARKLLKSRGYSEEVANGLTAALETRFAYLTRGKRGDILNVRHSTPWEQLFGQTTVINLSKIANARDRALIMSIIMLSLYEYRISAYQYDPEYQKRAQSNKLLHLTVVEEAHNVLTKPGLEQSGTGNPQQVVADLFGNMLSEIRAYGQGLMVIDQVPTRLIPDVLKNTNIKIAHRLASAEDAQVMADALALRPEQRDIIPTLAQGHAIIASDRDDAASWVKIDKPTVLL